MAFGTAGSGRRYVTIAVDLVALSLGYGTHEHASAAKVAEAPVFADFERRLRGAHVANARPRFTRRLRVGPEFPAAGGAALAVGRSARLRAVGLGARFLVAGGFTLAALADAAFVFRIVEFRLVSEGLSAEDAGFPAFAFLQLGHATFGVLQPDAEFGQRFRQVVDDGFQVLKLAAGRADRVGVGALLQIAVGPKDHPHVVEGSLEKLREVHARLTQKHLRVLVEDEALVDRDDDALVNLVAVDVQRNVTSADRDRHLKKKGRGTIDDDDDNDDDDDVDDD